MRDEFHAEHLAREFPRLVRALSQLHAAALAASARMYLRLDDHDIRAQLLRRVISLFGRARDEAARHGDVKLLQEFFRLILVNFHRSILSPGWYRPSASQVSR